MTMMRCHPERSAGPAFFLAILMLLLCATALAQNPPADRWAEWQPFIGEWEGVGSGSPGEGSGRFSFGPELQGAVLVRHSYAAYPATKDRPASRHDDLMVVYKQGQLTRADYWDNEGHVIRYGVELGDAGRKLTFLSEAVAGQPRFRLTYVKTGVDTLNLKFEIAPPNAPEKFATYIDASAKRAQRNRQFKIED
jgi:hypothetical protein